MKIATFNIHGWRTADGRPNFDRLTRTLTQIDADIVGLNEVFYPYGSNGDRGATGAQLSDPSIKTPALELLAAELGMHFVFGPCMRWPAQSEMPPNAYGNALLSRWPIVASAAHHLTPKEENLQQVLVGSEQRGMLEGRILLPNNETFTIYQTHLDHKDEAARLVQLRTLRTWTSRDRNRPHLLMGDFNAISPWDFTDRQPFFERLALHEKGKNLVNGEKGPQLVSQVEKAGYTDTLALFGEPGKESYMNADQPLRIDYIFASKPLVDSVKSCQVWIEPIGEEASDHRPVVAEVAY